MLGRRETERLGLDVLVRVEPGVDLPIADDQGRQDQPEEGRADDDRARQSDCVEHDVAKPGDFVWLDDFHYDRRLRDLHHSIVQQAEKEPL